MASSPRHQTECLECGAPLDAPHRGKEFCATACRTAFNNRRKARGAILYDLYMAGRWERAATADLKILSKVNRLAAVWRQEDEQRRDGRRSWGDWRLWLRNNPWIASMMPMRCMPPARR